MNRMESVASSRLDAILAPFASPSAGVSVSLEDLDGGLIAGTHPASAEREASRDIRSHGVVVARLVARGAGAGAPLVSAAIGALAAALEELVSEAAGLRAAEAALSTALRVADERSRRLDAELILGRRLQRSFVAIVPPDVPGYELASHYEAATEVGGDFFDLFRLRRRGQPLSVVIADVTGKGVAAALLMAFSRPLLHAAVDHASGPADALERTNRVLVQERHTPLFITALCATLTLGSGRLRIANAGHEPPLLARGDGSPIQSIEVAGPLLGAFGSLELSEADVELAPGDVVVFYTDGVTDARCRSGERFEDGRMLAAIEAARHGTAAGIVESIRAAVNEFQAGVDPADDVTIVAIRRRPRTARARG
ncbi:MAG: phosphoserine phosphatase RsbU/P [Chloroflexota bacterium]|nr:phosphoserine phosphatase RsbU/P [Chloroflexota bacterium]